MFVQSFVNFGAIRMEWATRITLARTDSLVASHRHSELLEHPCGKYFTESLLRLMSVELVLKHY